MWRNLLAVARQVVRLEWPEIGFGTALRLTPALVFVLAGGLVRGNPAGGAIAAGGALVVGLGAYQQFTRSRAAPMIFAAGGMSVSTFIGTLAGNGDATMALACLFYAFWCGVLPSIGMGAFWIGQQCTVFLIIAGAYPGGVGHALGRAALVLAGGAVQIMSYAIILVLARGSLSAPSLRLILADAGTALSGLAFHVRLRSPYFQFAVRSSLALVAAVLTERYLSMPNGYWVAMTALLLMRPDFQDTLTRSLGRIAGTLAGAAFATALVHLLKPGAPTLAALVAGAAFLAYATLRLNYGIFSLFVTAYIVFLLSLAGLAAPRVALDRIVSTLIGGCFALTVHLDFYRMRRARRRGAQA